MLRNLLYFIYPMKPKDGSPGVEWRLNLETLAKYREVFNGRTLFVIAYDELSEDPLEVQREVRVFFPRAWFWLVQNDKALGETVGFMQGLELLESTSSEEITFYAHAKGVSYEDKQDLVPRIREWREDMYRECLSNIPKIEAALTVYPCAGCFKKYGPWSPFAGVSWHYSGTYFWLKHSTLFSKPDWRFIYQHRFGVEVYPSTHFTKEQGYCLYKDHYRDRTDFMNWIEVAREALDKQIADAAKPPSVTLILPTAGRNTLRRVLLEAQAQLRDDDEVLVVGDGHCPAAELAMEGLDPRIKYLEYPNGPSKDWGHTPRNWATPFAKGTHIFHLDDDDRCLPGAFDAIRKAAKECPGKILIFRTKDISGVEIGGSHKLELGKVSTQMFVLPNVPGRFGTWEPRYGGDFDFIRQSVERHPEGEAGVVWRDEMLAIHNGHGLVI